MFKTYRKAKSERPNKIKRRWKDFRVKRKIEKELEDHENKTEMFEMQDSDYEENGRRY